MSAGARGYIDRVLRTRLCRYSIVVAALLAFGGSSADAEPAEAPQEVRAERPIAIALSPVFPWISGHDATVPLPALRLGLNVSPRLALELTGGGVPMGDGGRMVLVDVGARWFALATTVAPYLMARVGDILDRGNEGGDRSYPFAVAGGGLDYACACGLTAWVEAGAGLFSYEAAGPRSTELGGYLGVGIGYRLED